VDAFKKWADGNATYRNLQVLPDTRAFLSSLNGKIVDAVAGVLEGKDENKLLEGLPESAREVFLDAVFAGFSSAGHGNNIRDISTALAGKHPDEAGSLSTALLHLSARAVANYDQDHKPESLTYAGWLAAAAYDAVPEDKRKGVLLDTPTEKQVSLFARALLSRPNEKADNSEKLPDRLLKLIDKATPPAAGAKAFAAAFYRYAERHILVRTDGLIYRVLASATPHERALGQVDADAFSKVMNDLAVKALIVSLPPGGPEREMVLAAMEMDPGDFQKNPGTALARLVLMLARKDVDAWQAWQQEPNLPDQKYVGRDKHGLAIRLALRSPDGPDPDPALVQLVRNAMTADLYSAGTVNSNQAHNGEWFVRSVRAPVFDQGNRNSVTAIQVRANGKAVTVAVDGYGLVKGSYVSTCDSNSGARP
jgi:hypothetical protein